MEGEIGMGRGEPVPEQKGWSSLLEELDQLKDVAFPKCVKNIGVIGSDCPMCILSDAFAACMYLRWEKNDMVEVIEALVC